MLFHSRARCPSVTWPWRHRVLALLLGGLFLVAFDCGALLHGPDHSHGSSHTSSSSIMSGSHSGDAAEEEALPADESCSMLGLDDEDEGLSKSQPNAPALALPPATAAGGMALAGAALSRLRSLNRARSGRSRLTAVCRWRI